MIILVGCEESQAVTIELRKLGHEAYSCDKKDCSGGYPEWHIKGNVLEILNPYKNCPMGIRFMTQDFKTHKIHRWDMAIFFPDCTYLTNTANKWLKDQPARKSGALVGLERRNARVAAIEFFMKLYNCDIKKICIENPVGIMSTEFKRPDQYVHPYYFGDPHSKKTCLWLKGLPDLIHYEENHVEPKFYTYKDGRRDPIWHVETMKLPKDERSRLRSKTFPGIAKAMAEQWTK